MIKIENGILYLTAGETCCVFKVAEDKTLRRVYFGKRVEFEDDVCALLGVRPECEGMRGGEFKFICAEVLADKPRGGSPVLYGGKTLRVVLEDGEKALRAELFVTPYSRGGFTRRIRLTNKSGKAVSVDCERTVFELPEPCETVYVGQGGGIAKGTATPSGENNGLGNFTALLSRGADSYRGDAFGFFSVFGDGTLSARQTELGMTVTVSPTVKKLKLGAGESAELPEVLFAYSDKGLNGMSRVIHDIVREYMFEDKLERRPPVVMLATTDEKKLCKAAEVAFELGCDAFAVDIGRVGDATLGAVASTCREIGIKTGVRVKLDRIEERGAAFGEEFTAPTENGCYEITNTEKLAARLEKLVSMYALDYMLVELPTVGSGRDVRAMYVLGERLKKLNPDITVEWGIVPRDLVYAESLCYPTALMRTVVSARAVENGELKTVFDAASVGRLAYELDPLEQSDGVKRAIRAQVFSYQDDAPCALFGDLYRSTMTGGECMTFVSKDKSKAYAVCMPTEGGIHKVFLTGIDEHNLYNVREMNKTFSGAALVSCGVTVGSSNSFTLHLRQVADYD